MKKAIGILVLILVIIVVVVLLNSGAPEDLEKGVIQDVDTSSDENTDNDSTSGDNSADLESKVTVDSFNFTGYGPGKEHLSTFDDYSVSDVEFDETGLPTKGKITFVVSSVNTDAGEMLNNHLCTDDFFDCAKYPNIVFDLVKITENEAGSYTVTGNLTFHGVTKQVSFGVNRVDDTFSADFTVDTTPFNFKYTAIDKDVRIQFSGTIN